MNDKCEVGTDSGNVVMSNENQIVCKEKRLNICKARFYNAQRAEMFGYELTTTDRLVFVKSRPHTHIEWQFSERYSNLSFSASFKDGGCRFKQIGYSTPEFWDTIEILLTDEQEDAAYHRAEELSGKEYDWLGAVLFNPDHKDQKLDPDKYFCSETWAELYLATGHNLMLPPERYMPVFLFTEIFYWLARIKYLKAHTYFIENTPETKAILVIEPIDKPSDK